VMFVLKESRIATKHLIAATAQRRVKQTRVFIGCIEPLNLIAATAQRRVKRTATRHRSAASDVVDASVAAVADAAAMADAGVAVRLLGC
jgi:hypothetical protein